MECDGLKAVLVVDLDGTFLGCPSRGTLLPRVGLLYTWTGVVDLWVMGSMGGLCSDGPGGVGMAGVGSGGLGWIGIDLDRWVGMGWVGSGWEGSGCDGTYLSDLETLSITWLSRCFF